LRFLAVIKDIVTQQWEVLGLCRPIHNSIVYRRLQCYQGDNFI